MPKKIQKTLQHYLSKIKNAPPQIQLPLSSPKNWILSGCKHSKTPSFAVGDSNNHNHDAATLSDVDRFLFENFKSLFLDEETKHSNNNTTKSHDHEETPKLGPISFDSPCRLMDPPRDLCGSNRFFVKPSFSGSLVDSITTTCDEAGSSSTSTTTLNDSSSHHAKDEAIMDLTLPDNCIALLTYSPSPHEDFKRSMQDMVEARLRKHERVDWDFMEELLFSYLNLNERKSYKFILSAFVDLVALMRRNTETAPRKPRSVRTVRIGSEARKKKTQEVTLKFGSP